MSESSQKLKRVQPIIRARKSRLDAEVMQLSQLRIEKKATAEHLRNLQNDYMGCIEKLNQERMSRTRGSLTVLERDVDVLKARWYKGLRKLRELEGLERAQIAQVLVAERDLKSIEKLEGRYEEAWRNELNQAEARRLDEVGIRRFSEQKPKG